MKTMFFIAILLQVGGVFSLHGSPAPTLVPTTLPSPTPTPIAHTVSDEPVVASSTCSTRSFGLVTGDMVTCVLSVDASDKVEFDFGRMPGARQVINGLEIRSLTMTSERVSTRIIYHFHYTLQALQVFPKTTNVPFDLIEIAWRKIGANDDSSWNSIIFPAVRIAVGQVSDFEALNQLKPPEWVSPPMISLRATGISAGAILLVLFSAWWLARIVYRDRVRRKTSAFLWALNSIRQAQALNAREAHPAVYDIDRFALLVCTEAIRKTLSISGAPTGNAVGARYAVDRRYQAFAFQVKSLWDMCDEMRCNDTSPPTGSVEKIIKLLEALVVRERKGVIAHVV